MFENIGIKIETELEETFYCNYNDETIKRLAEKLSGTTNEHLIIVKYIFIYVRDNIRFGFDAVNIKASETLAKGYGACWNKALLMVTLLRNLKIPSRVVYDPLVRTFGKPCFGIMCHLSNNPFNHGLVQVFLNERWIRIDPTLDCNTFETCFKPLNISWSNEWDGKNDMKIYAESIHGPMVIIKEIDKIFSSDFGNSIPPSFLMNLMNKKLWRKTQNKI